MTVFIAAFLIGIFSYVIFFLGIFNLLYKDLVAFIAVSFVIGFIFWNKEWLRNIRFKELNKGSAFLIGVFSLQALVNIIGVLGPELGFDALWYHLTLPKIYLDNNSIFYIPGGLFYYSAMPKLAEMLYIGGLSIGNEILVKQIHFIFGLLTCYVLYKIQRKFFSQFISLLGIVIFYSNLVVAWESSAAYIDLVRVFYEAMAIWGFLNWIEKKDAKWLFICAAMIGFAITTKLLAFGSLGIFTVLLVMQQSWKPGFWKSVKYFLRFLIPFWLIALMIPLPWFIFSYLNTGNPIYPLFSPILKEHTMNVFSLDLINPLHFLQTVWNVAVKASDPISPVYIIIFPLIILFWKKLFKMKLIIIYALLSLLLWYITAKVEGSRLLLPGLIAFTILCTACINEATILKKYYLLKKLLLVVIVFVAFVSIGYRFVANVKYVPFIIGQQTKQEFLSKHLNFSFGDFYDIDGYFKKTIKQTDKVLLHGFHNLYYMDFPFVDETWVKKEDRFNYIATQNAGLPEEFYDWKLIYQNDKTLVKLYKKQ